MEWPGGPATTSYVPVGQTMESLDCRAGCFGQPAVLIYDPSWTSSSRSTMLLTAPVRMADCSPKP